MIRIVVDKPEYLPKPRDLLHESRSEKTGNTGKPLHKHGHNERPYALQTRALSRKSVIRKTGAVFVRKYDGLISREPFATRLWPVQATVFAVVFPVNIPFFDFSIDGNVR